MIDHAILHIDLYRLFQYAKLRHQRAVNCNHSIYGIQIRGPGDHSCQHEGSRLIGIAVSCIDRIIGMIVKLDILSCRTGKPYMLCRADLIPYRMQ